MKEFISGVAILLILMIFPLQAQTDTMNAFKINNLNEVVFNAAEQARFDGRFTTENINDIKSKLSQVFGVSIDDVIFEGTTEQKYRTNVYDDRERVEYKITVPFGTLISSADFLGIDEEVNNKRIVKEGYVYSEVLRP